MIKLKITASRSSHTVREFTTNSVTIGRAVGSDIPYSEDHPHVSEKHAIVELKGMGYSLRDLGSTNGTFLNGSQLKGLKQLTVGDKIILGKPGIDETRIDVLSINVIQEKSIAALQKPIHRAAGKVFSNSGQPAIGNPPSKQQSDTRGLLIDMQDRHKRYSKYIYRIGTAVSLVVLLGFSLLFYNFQQPSKEFNFDTVVSSCVWIHDLEGGTGSGFLIDRANRLIVTNAHVVGSTKNIAAWFPIRKEDGSLVRDVEEYTNSLPVLGEVVCIEPSKDIALIQLQHVPGTVNELPLATNRITEGYDVYTAGNPGVFIANDKSLWVLSSGTVKAFIKDWEDDNKSIRADILVTNNDILHGDSGGPIMNRQGEVVAIVCQGQKKASSGGREIPFTQNHCIDVTEIRKVLDSYRKKNSK